MKQDDIRKVLSSLIHEARLSKGMTREELAERMHAHVTSVTAWENGNAIPHEKKRIQLSQILGIDIVNVDKCAEPQDPPGKLVFLEGSENPHRVIELVSQIFDSAKSNLKTIRMNHMDSDKRMQLKPYFDTLTKVTRNQSLSYSVVECVYGKRRVLEILNNIILLDEYNYHIKAFPMRGPRIQIPQIDMYMCDDAQIILSGYTSSRNAHEKPKLIFNDPQACAFYVQYWTEIWNKAEPLNYLGASDLSAIRAFAQLFDVSDTEFDQAVSEAEVAKENRQIRYLL